MLIREFADLITCEDSRSSCRPSLSCLASRTARAIFPTATPVFPRGRWLKSHATVNSFGLLANVHHLADQVIPLWVASLRGAPKALPPHGQPLFHASDAPIDADDSSDEVPAAGPSTRADGSVDWTAYNECQRGSALRLANSGASPTIIVAKVCMRPMVGLSQALLARSGDTYRSKAFEDCIDSGSLRCRVGDAHAGKLTTPFFHEMRRTVSSPAAWRCLLPRFHNTSFLALAWAMAMRAAAAIFQLMFLPQRGYPWKLWGLLSQDRQLASDILSDPPCLKDHFTTARILSSVLSFTCVQSQTLVFRLLLSNPQFVYPRRSFLPSARWTRWSARIALPRCS